MFLFSTCSLLSVLIYFLPTIVAAHRGHHVTGILLLNFFLGWTGLGWLAMMLWALLATPRYYVAPATAYYVPQPPVGGSYPNWRG